MFAKQQVFTIRDVPALWILETFLGLEHMLTGQTIRMKSVFRPDSTHKDPLTLYFNRDAGEYRFKCFSTGRGGKIVDLMMAIWNLDFHETAIKIEVAYQQYLLSGAKPADVRAMSVHRWQVVGSTIRPWSQSDADFWSAYNINSQLLEADLVRPLVEYAMLKFENGIETDNGFTVNGPHIYGYFTPEGELYKIYQPFNGEQKFIKVGSYLQGNHTLQGHPYLCLSSGMKDMLALKSLKLRVDYVSPDSENNLLSYEQLVDLQLRHEYKAIITLLDIDKTGVESMRAYQQRYNLPYCYLKLEKDAALSIKTRGALAVRDVLAPMIQRVATSFTGLTDNPRLITS